MTQYNPVKAGQKITVKVSDGCEVVIRRPNGELETVQNPAGCREMNPALFARMKAATKAAGRGELVSYKNKQKDAEYTVTAADAAVDSTAQIERLMKE